MTSRNTEAMLEITGIDPNGIERDLNRAEMLLRQEAMKHRSGILITRHSQTRFTVAVSGSVPFGVTQELSAW
ncbi:hypothetical protein [Arthrobacter sp. NPDC056493]|uniref:hypothetical protein n=1 Tax=Arthrobacter sp. NPDC056493 TaxID=3345839 RepID=UPI00366B64EC